MNLQTRIVIGILSIAGLAAVTGYVLLLGYALAGSMFVLIAALLTRGLLRRTAGQRRRQPKGLSLASGRESRHRHRPAA